MKKIFQLLLSLSLLALLLREMDFDSALKAWQQLSVGAVALALLMQSLSFATVIWRWFSLMRLLGFEQSWRFNLASHYRSMLIGQVLPTSIGADALRLYDTSKLGRGRHATLWAVLSDRLLGVLGLFGLGALVLTLAAPPLPPQLLASLQLFSSLGLSAAIVGLPLVLWLSRQLTRWPQFQQWFEPARALLQWRLLLPVLLSVAVHLFSFTAFYALGQSLGLQLSLSTIWLVMPVVTLVSMLPISLGGWGLRELAVATVFSYLGANKNIAILTSVMYGLNFVAASLPGVYFMAFGKRS